MITIIYSLLYQFYKSYVVILLATLEFSLRNWYLGLMERAVRIAIGRVGAIVVIGPKSMNAKISFGFSCCWIATTLLCVTV